MKASSFVLIFLSAGYLQSVNCMREFRCAVACGKPIILVQETDRAKGAMTKQEVEEACDNPDLRQKLYERTPIDWFRLSEVQQVSLLLIVKNLVSQDEADSLYIPGGPFEKLRAATLPAAEDGRMLYASPQNPGALQAAHELLATFEEAASAAARPSVPRVLRRPEAPAPATLTITENMDTLASNGVFFLLLDAFTWRAESHVAKLRKAKLTAELNEAMRNGVKVAGRALA